MREVSEVTGALGMEGSGRMSKRNGAAEAAPCKELLYR
ncbi:MAG TPA: hypothetical protein DEF41_14605 [Desulfovibrio sp.]|uniref:Uncharacterized protein n=1 Tax=Nitratidesulfovibrio vulgaris (strain ATCC 29579 / DSM 644 / CCUG 34227 / NCIMB 8303 / VKM B-1760 / Hildenborough) TaxID=882 RepID=Q729C5_NITV2|nr:hypothetical protein DVU_2426 [Nitratidesulfovibrio vulgaris str. Hildenborough]HBW17311.1 hypothetical protein [Desulfovibrio sp.]